MEIRGAGQPPCGEMHYAAPSPVWNGLENPAQAAKTGEAQAKPRYETEVRGKFRGGGGQDCVR